jgi:hypothetical protein
MTKVTAYILLFCSCLLIAGTYGMIHDQLTYSISPEYYTKFKFIMFGTDPALPQRVQAGIVGFKAAWWTGIPVGIVLVSIGLIHYEGRTMFRVTMQAIGVALLVTVLAGLAGLAYGKLVLAGHDRAYFNGWFIPDDVRDPDNYIAVGAMHSFSYLGGAIGIFAGSGWQVWMKKKIKKQRAVNAPR